MCLASCRESRQEAESHGQSLQEAIFLWTVVLAGSKRLQTVSAEAKYDGQSLQEAKLSGLVYTLWSTLFIMVSIMMEKLVIKSF